MDYAELTARLAELLDRDDLTNEIPFFIEQAEEGFAAPTELGGLRHWRMKRRAIVTVQEQYLTIPPGYLETIRMFNQSSGDRMELLSREVKAQCFGAIGQRGSTAVFAQHQFRPRKTNILGAHDLIRCAFLQHSVLVDPGFVGKRIATDDRLVPLDEDAGNARHQPAGRYETASLDVGIGVIVIAASP